MRFLEYCNPEKFANLELDCIHISGSNTLQILDKIRSLNIDKMCNVLSDLIYKEVFKSSFDKDIFNFFIYLQ